jgi:hypothetical protein
MLPVQAAFEMRLLGDEHKLGYTSIGVGVDPCTGALTSYNPLAK